MEPNNEQFLQVWQYLLDNEELDLTDVLLLSKIISLHSTKDGCYMTNEYICKILRLKNVPTASRRINKLHKLGYVELRYIPAPNNPNKTKRFILPTYENGLILKSSRVDLKVNPPLTQESIPLDSKVNTPLTLESTPPCLESQSIISTYYINEDINQKHQVDEINKINKGFLIETINEKFVGELKEMLQMLVEDGFLTSKQKNKLVQNKPQIVNKIPALEQYINF